MRARLDDGGLLSVEVLLWWLAQVQDTHDGAWYRTSIASIRNSP